MVRAGTHSIADIRMLKRKIEVQACEDLSNLMHPMALWKNNSAALVVCRMMDDVDWDCFIDFYDKDQSEVGKRVKFQKRICEFSLATMYPFSLRCCLKGKLSRWFPEDQCESFSFKAIDILNTIKNTAPCIVFAVVSMWCNGWCTDGRFQGDTIKCLVCSECDGRDKLEHYADCMYAWDAGKKCTGITDMSEDLVTLLGFNSKDFGECVLLSVYAYALKRHIDSRRAMACAAPKSNVYRNVWSGFQVAAIYSRRVRTILGQRLF